MCQIRGVSLTHRSVIDIITLGHRNLTTFIIFSAALTRLVRLRPVAIYRQQFVYCGVEFGYTNFGFSSDAQGTAQGNKTAQEVSCAKPRTSFRMKTAAHTAAWQARFSITHWTDPISSFLRVVACQGFRALLRHPRGNSSRLRRGLNVKNIPGRPSFLGSAPCSVLGLEPRLFSIALSQKLPTSQGTLAAQTFATAPSLGTDRVG